MKKILLFVALVLAAITLVSCGEPAMAPANEKKEMTGAEMALKIYANGAFYGEGGNTFIKVAADPVEIAYYNDTDRVPTLVSNHETFLNGKKEAWEKLKESGASFTYEVVKTTNVGEEDLVLVKDYFVNEEEYGYTAEDIEEVVILDVKALLIVNGTAAPYSLNLLHPDKISEMPFVKVRGVWCYKSFLTKDFISELK